jgi:hypothetical protein
MNDVERMKYVMLLEPETKNNGAFTTNNYVDTRGWDKLRVVIQYGVSDCTVGSTNAATTALLVEESADTSFGSATAVTGAALSAVLSATGDHAIRAIDIDLRKTHERYMRVQAPTASNSTGAGLAILGILSGKASGTFGGGAAESGLSELVQV